MREVAVVFASRPVFRPWIVYWTTHALDLLDVVLSDEKKTEICEVGFIYFSVLATSLNSF